MNALHCAADGARWRGEVASHGHGHLQEAGSSQGAVRGLCVRCIALRVQQSVLAVEWMHVVERSSEEQEHEE